MSSSIPSWQILTAHAQPFRGARDLAFCLKVPLDSLLVWASSEGSGETARMRRLAWTFAARIGDKYQIRLTRSILKLQKQQLCITLLFHIYYFISPFFLFLSSVFFSFYLSFLFVCCLFVSYLFIYYHKIKNRIKLIKNNVKVLNTRTPQTFAVITLKFEQDGFTKK